MRDESKLGSVLQHPQPRRPQACRANKAEVTLRLSPGLASHRRVEALLNIYLLRLRSQVVGSKTGEVSNLAPHPFATARADHLVPSLGPG